MKHPPNPNPNPNIKHETFKHETPLPTPQGVLAIRRPWPGMMRTVYGDHQRFETTYFSDFTVGVGCCWRWGAGVLGLRVLGLRVLGLGARGVVGFGALGRWGPGWCWCWGVGAEGGGGGGALGC